jgi:SurA N-terminal domain
VTPVSRTFARTRTRRLLVALVVVPLAMAVLSACGSSGALPGSAAVVGQQTISESSVLADAREVQAYAAANNAQAPDAQALIRAQIQREVSSILYASLAEQHNITVSQGDVDTLIAQAVGASNKDAAVQQIALNYGVPPSQFDAYVHDAIVEQKLEAVLAPGKTGDAASAVVLDALIAEANSLGVQVSPRYGTWNPKTAQVDPPPSDVASSASPSPIPVPIASLPAASSSPSPTDSAASP